MRIKVLSDTLGEKLRFENESYFVYPIQIGCPQGAQFVFDDYGQAHFLSDLNYTEVDNNHEG